MDTKSLDHPEQSAMVQSAIGTKSQEFAEGASGNSANDSSGPEVEAPWVVIKPESDRSTSQFSEGTQKAGVSSDDSAATAEQSHEKSLAGSPAASTPATFGFQSLSGLLPGPKVVPRSAEDYRFIDASSSDRSEPPFSASQNLTDKSIDANEGWGLSAISAQESKPERERFVGSVPRELEDQSSSHLSARIASGDPKNDMGHATFSSRRRGGESSPRSPRPKTATSMTSAPLARYPDHVRSPNPFDEPSSAPTKKPLEEGKDFKRIRPPGTVRTQAENPWGLSKDDTISLESVLQPGSQESMRHSVLKGTAAAKHSELEHPNLARSSASTPTSPNEPRAAKLTHLTSSGEAHMVDVGSKSSTRRVAVAFGTVCFSNPKPFRLIEENSNKKGDVLGVARIAGIMAAKRTSDLIPLCHPIGLTKVEVNVKLRAHNHGLVTIQTLVECTGPTGVEMEALSALSGAALTVYDMCKAVDKEMKIESMRVVYKSGGRSGEFYDDKWLSMVSKKFFVQHGLQWPSRQPAKKTQVEEATKKDEDHRGQDFAEPVEAQPSTQTTVDIPGRRLARSVDGSSLAPTDISSHVGQRSEEDYGSLITLIPTAEVRRTSRSPWTPSALPQPKTCRMCGLHGFKDFKELLSHFVDEHGWTMEEHPNIQGLEKPPGALKFRTKDRTYFYTPPAATK